MTLTTSPLAEEGQRAAFLCLVHRVSIAPRESIDWRIGEDQREFELRDGAREHREVDRAAGGNRRKQRAEALPVRRGCVETLQHDRADRVVSRSRGVRGRQTGPLAV